MGKLFKIVLFAVAALVVLLSIAISLTIGWRPFIGPRVRPLKDRTFERTPQRLARGQYLSYALGCFECHGAHDWTKHDAPLLAGSLGASFAEYPQVGLPGRVFAPNITPDPETGAGRWTNDMLARAIREGISHDGRALFPMMPYPNFRHISDADLASLIVYLHSIPPIRRALPMTQPIFIVRYLMRIVPQPIIEPVPQPDSSTPVNRGEYLVTISGCIDCHTPAAKGRPIRGLEFSGGVIMEGPWGRVATANITPDPSGICYYDEALFLEMIHTGYVKARTINQIMAWWDYRNLTDEDLKGIFAYLRTVKPVKHRVDNTEPPTFCKLCGASHGAGNQN